ncbi:MAG TPA: serine/threonine-protein kinase [Gaiellaceae bacterium]|nr:serine/threonine-protein kinase [Gaiellaceae bacterium]
MGADYVWEQDSWELAEGDVLAPGRTAVRLLGGGRRYEAYLVWDDTLRALAVAKVVRPGQTGNERTLAGLAGEAEALSRLAHPSLVRCFDAVLDGERPHLLLELLDGPRLSTLERRYGVVVEQLLPLALQLCSALHYMHGQGWAHLDVKPRNIIMSSTPKLIDLSVAQPFEVAREAVTPIGTDAYMAPEQCDPARVGEIGPASDSWGLGVTLYEALAGERPFPNGDPGAGGLAERYPQVAHAPEPLEADVLPPLRATVHGCLADDPAERPLPAEIADALEPLAALLPLPRLGRFRPGSKPSRPPAPAR